MNESPACPGVRRRGAGMHEALVARVRRAFGARRGLTERKMFGGVAFLLDGKMCCGVTKDGDVVVRVGADAYDEALLHPHARECDFTGRPLRGMVLLTPAGMRSRQNLPSWVARAAAFVASLPARKAKEQTASRRGPTPSGKARGSRRP